MPKLYNSHNYQLLDNQDKSQPMKKLACCELSYRITRLDEKKKQTDTKKSATKGQKS